MEVQQYCVLGALPQRDFVRPELATGASGAYTAFSCLMVALSFDSVTTDSALQKLRRSLETPFRVFLDNLLSMPLTVCGNAFQLLER